MISFTFIFMCLAAGAGGCLIAAIEDNQKRIKNGQRRTRDPFLLVALMVLFIGLAIISHPYHEQP